MGALSSYQQQTALLLHDPSYQYFTQPTLTTYINTARNRVAQDSKCLRQLVGYSAGTSLALTQGQDNYTAQTFLPATVGPYLVDIMGISIWWGTMRIKLAYFPYTQLDAMLRRWSTYQGRPVAFTRMGGTQIWIEPSPDQAYQTDWDVVVIPQPLVTDATVEQLPVPFQESVPFYAAYLAKFQEQAIGESQIFLKQYVQNIQWCMRGFMTRVIQNPYRISA
jgi:hypothetical protein